MAIATQRSLILYIDIPLLLRSSVFYPLPLHDLRTLAPRGQAYDRGRIVKSTRLRGGPEKAQRREYTRAGERNLATVLRLGVRPVVRERLRKGSWWPSGISLALRPTCVHRASPSRSLRTDERGARSLPPRWNPPRGERPTRADLLLCRSLVLAFAEKKKMYRDVPAIILIS